MGEPVEALYAELKARMQRGAAGMTPTEAPDGVTWHAAWPNPARPKEAMWFGRVQPRKAYVAVHLMPVYSHPELLDGLSPALKKRMQGKSCFNFAKTEPEVFEELEALVRRCAEAYAAPFEFQRSR